MTEEGESGRSNRLAVCVIAKNVTYKIREKRSSWKTILNNINLCAQPSQLTAIMGASGSGKTTLLNVLADRVRVGRAHELKGNVLFNGQVCPANVNKFSNYVMQADHLLEFLTVEETIRISAKLKLKRMSPEAREARVERVIEELGLQECRKVKVGGEGTKGISGGQKKRVSIAVELLDEPSLLFLDEPTSGLDSSLAYDILHVLLDLARGGRTVVCTVHQPRSQVFLLFDQLMLLSRGEVVYQGPANETITYFSGLGYECPPHFNPADFFLDVLSAKKTSAEILALDQEISCTKISQVEDGVGPEPAANRKTPSSSTSVVVTSRRLTSSVILGRVVVSEEEVASLPELYRQSVYASRVETLIDQIEKNASADYENVQKKIQQYLKQHKPRCSDWLRDFWVLSGRTALNSMRNPMESRVQVFINIGFGLIIGGLYFQMNQGGTGAEAYSNAGNFAGCLYFTVTQYSFSQLDALLAFPKNRALFNRETANGLYAPSAYYAAENFAKAPFQLIPPALFATLVYWMAGLAPDAGQFFQHLLIALLIVFTSVGYCFMIGSAFPRVEIVNIVAPTGIVVFMILSGFLLKDADIPWWIGWLKYVSWLRYSFFSLLQTQFPAGGTFGDLTNEEVLRFLGVPLSPSVWLNILFLLLCGISMRLLGFLMLAYTNRRWGIEA